MFEFCRRPYGMSDTYAPDPTDSPEGRGVRYTTELWALIQEVWESHPTLSYNKAVQIIAERTGQPVPSKGACATYAQRNGWTKADPAGIPKAIKQHVTRETAKNVLDPKKPEPLPEPEVTQVLDADWEVVDLAPMQRRFVEEFLISGKGAESARRAGYAQDKAARIAYDLLREPDVAEAVAAGRRAISNRTNITADKVVKMYWDIATADVNSLVEFRRDNCRHCHGEGFAYQWRDVAEFIAAEMKFEARRAKAIAKGKGDDFTEEPPTDVGGYGFVRLREPNPDCRECEGDGHGYMHIHDTRRLTGAARLLYNGVKMTKDGLEALTLDRKHALDVVAKHIGVFKEHLEVDMRVTSTAELDQVFEAQMEKARQLKGEFKGRGDRLRLVGNDG